MAASKSQVPDPRTTAQRDGDKMTAEILPNEVNEPFHRHWFESPHPGMESIARCICRQEQKALRVDRDLNPSR